jgi:hypothetical protein
VSINPEAIPTLDELLVVRSIRVGTATQAPGEARLALL